MQIHWLGWAGVEVEAQGEHVVVDPLDDAEAVFAWLGDRLAEIPVPEVVPANPGAVAGLLTHLHRDHADAEALDAAVANGARSTSRSITAARGSSGWGCSRPTRS